MLTGESRFLSCDVHGDTLHMYGFVVACDTLQMDDDFVIDCDTLQMDDDFVVDCDALQMDDDLVALCDGLNGDNDLVVDCGALPMDDDFVVDGDTSLGKLDDDLVIDACCICSNGIRVLFPINALLTELAVVVAKFCTCLLLPVARNEERFI